MNPKNMARGLLSLLLLLAPFLDTLADDAAPPASGSAAAVTPNVIKARLDEIEASTELDDDTKAVLAEFYRKALSNLQREHANTQAFEAFQKARETAPAKEKAERSELERLKREKTQVILAVSERNTLDEIEQVLLNEKANQAAVDAKLAEIEKQLEAENERPGVIRQRLMDARSRLEDVEKELKIVDSSTDAPLVKEAKQWSLVAEQKALNSEIRMLDQELLSQPMRIGLLKARQERMARSLDRMKERVQLLEELIGRKRRSEAEQAQAEAEEAMAEMAGKHPLIQELAGRNAALTERLSRMSADLETVAGRGQQAEETAKRIEDELNSTRQKLEVAGLNQVLGRVLLEQRRLLPDIRSIRREAKEREHLIATAALNQIQDNDELKRLRDLDTYMAGMMKGLTPGDARQVEPHLRELLVKRQELLAKAISLDEAYLRALGELDFAQNRLIDAIESYDEFLAERLLWIRSAPPPSLQILLAMPSQVADLLEPHKWHLTGQVLASRLAQSPSLWLSLLVLALLLAKRRKIRKALEETGRKIVKARYDRFTYTLQALGLTLLLALPWPLVMGVAGWQMSLSLESTDFIKSLAQALMVVAPALFYLKAFDVMCLPGGLATAHFRWPETTTRALRRQLRILMSVFVPAALVAIVTITDTSDEFGGGLGRTAFLFIVLSLAYFFYRLFSPKGSILRDMFQRNPDSSLARLRHLWLVLTLLLSAFLVVLAVSGFLYTAAVLTSSLIDTLWLILGLIVLYQLAVRWLLMARRKLTLAAALERRRAAHETDAHEGVKGEAGQYQVKEPEVDLIALNKESLKLLNTTLSFVSLIGLWFIWSDVLPAFGMLDNISLWHYKGMVGGEEQIIPVSLADLFLAVLVVIVTVVATRHFPALLEIILLRRFSTTSGGRYAATTLSRYFIAAVGILFALSIVGASWSQVQWLAAALSVGIGFGLQEIVANFISGIIILFERPIRVGDVVTIGEADGVVTRIQIRATTIRTWDGQELLVPNKEFITGRLLNWSLSDQTTRIKIPVGIAYGSDVQKAMALLYEAADENESVLREPGPSVIFESFGDNTLNLVLRCFVGAQDDRMPTLTALHEAIDRKFNEAGIVIAFPQRDVHLDTSRPLEVRISREKDQISKRKE